jgi:hypothetical protein
LGGEHTAFPLRDAETAGNRESVLARLRRISIALPLFAVAAVACLVAFGIDLMQHGSPEIARAQPPQPQNAPSTPPGSDYVCTQPRIEIPRTTGCRNHGAYPRCKWQVPDAQVGHGLYRIWRNTTPEHRWARPGLVSVVLGAAASYSQRWPGERMTIGDLDAPGPRHRTHDRGHDVDLYLEQAMLVRNEGHGRYVENYEGRSTEEVASMRARVMDLAKILAHCAHGEIRIYYNDPEIVAPFVSWFGEQGMRSSVGAAMQPHNDLHRFHFHLTIADNVEPLPPAPSAPLPSAAESEEQ